MSKLFLILALSNGFVVSKLGLTNITADNLSNAKPAVQQRHPGD